MIALVVPRWETENRLHHFLGREGVREDERYPKFTGDEGRAAQPTVTALARMIDGVAAAPDNLPSIGEATLELRRLP